LGIGDWGPIPNPQSPIPNIKNNKYNNYYYKLSKLRINNNNNSNYYLLVSSPDSVINFNFKSFKSLETIDLFVESKLSIFTVAKIVEFL